MFWVRIDNRLIHGQIIETWLPYAGTKLLIVANDDLASDQLRQEIMSMAIPEDVRLEFMTVQETSSLAQKMEYDGDLINTMVLFANCPDAKKSYEAGFQFHDLNIGNLHYSPGKKQLCPHVAVNEEDEACLNFFCQKNITLDYRCVPDDNVQPRTLS